MTLVTVSRQMGSHGARIAKSLAKDLGWTFADKTLIDSVLRQYGIPQLSKIYDEPPSIWELFDEDATTTINMLDATMKAIAARGDTVILGRGGFSLFADYADALHVLIKAPLERRAQRIARRDAMPLEDALTRVKADDAMRRKFVRMFYGKDWAKENQFDLVIDTAETSDEQAHALVKEALAAMPTPGLGAHTTSGIVVDSVLAETLDEVFGAR
ncbi:cytidylate kinase-like family protein [Actinotalea sp. M2MS4P-6]|uniref:cytidylate kinase-like family protein n=1 Tax=Actinotalea sp. M2MS4P-6 TaxID=2983762 RepID=UPI0021E42EBD|nr:cytidylate kinase-like family protein [Actinotalea sp. M2MS4P-6]MCV2394652.1 cytidylate kinase-like family protein [Actinotalea sp. M2MS4P-6]